MVVGQVRRIAPWLAVLAIVAGGVVLGVLQVRWIGEASRAEEVRLRASLYRGVEQVRNHAEDEVRVLLSIARSATAALASGDDAGISESLRLWQENTRFPGLLRGFWLVMDTATGRSRSWSPGSSAFVVATPPAEVAATLPGAASQADEMGAWQIVELPDRRRLVLLPVRRQAAAVAVEIDGRVFTGEIVPFYMNRNLAEFPWRLVDAGDGTTLGESGRIADGAAPEAMVGLRSLGLSGSDARTARRPVDGSEDGPLDPLLQAWLQRAHGESVTVAQPPEQLPGEGAEALLVVFYPGGTLAGTVRARQASSLAVSLGLVAMLVAGVGVLTRLYRRSVRLRASEQEFVASVSHELRTPIAVIQATSDNLRTGAVSDPSRLPRYAGVIHGQVRRLAGMVESILLYAGLESGRSRRPASAEVALPQLLDEVTQPLAQLAAERGCRLAVTATALPPAICADRTALRLVVENLVTNAIHHAGPTEVRLGVRWRPDATLEITVDDDGAGIPAREQARVFEPFVRGERSVREQRPGSGLGLHLVRRVAGLHGGRVTLASPYRDDAGVPRSGCRFVAVLPAPESCDEG